MSRRRAPPRWGYGGATPRESRPFLTPHPHLPLSCPLHLHLFPAAAPPPPYFTPADGFPYHIPWPSLSAGAGFASDSPGVGFDHPGSVTVVELRRMGASGRRVRKAYKRPEQGTPCGVPSPRINLRYAEGTDPVVFRRQFMVLPDAGAGASEPPTRGGSRPIHVMLLNGIDMTLDLGAMYTQAPGGVPPSGVRVYEWAPGRGWALMARVPLATRCAAGVGGGMAAPPMM